MVASHLEVPKVKTFQSIVESLFIIIVLYLKIPGILLKVETSGDILVDNFVLVLKFISSYRFLGAKLIISVTSYSRGQNNERIYFKND